MSLTIISEGDLSMNDLYSARQVALIPPPDTIDEPRPIEIVV